jgi:hypothetical protein
MTTAVYASDRLSLVSTKDLWFRRYLLVATMAVLAAASVLCLIRLCVGGGFFGWPATAVALAVFGFGVLGVLHTYLDLVTYMERFRKG